MRDLSLHLLDLAQNSITAGADLVTIRISLDDSGMLTMELTDDGKGMSPELLERVTSPFATTRTTRNCRFSSFMPEKTCCRSESFPALGGS